MAQETIDLAIIGGGAAGYTAAIYAARASMSVSLFEQAMPGGQITTTDEIENYPGFAHISGMELGMKFQEHAESLGVETTYDTVASVTITDEGLFELNSASNSLLARSLIIATGATPKLAGFDGEDAFRGRGISYCATCDGMFYRGKDVYVIGGGNAACEEGLFLANIASHVTMVVRRDEFRAPKGVVDKLLANDKVSVMLDTSIIKVAGDQLISSITLKNNKTLETYERNVDEGSTGIFVFAGTSPQVDLVRELIDLGPDGGIRTDEGMATRTPGLFAAGDVRTKRLRQVITAAADGAIAATSAYEYVSNKK